MTTLSTAARNALVNALANLVDAGIGPGEFRFYSTGFSTLLATAVCQDPAFAAAVAGSRNLAAAITGINVVASGTAAVFRLTDSAGNIVLDGTVGVTDSLADIDFTSVTWTSGDAIDLSTYTLTVPAT